jgi:hypothetical protein
MEGSTSTVDVSRNFRGLPAPDRMQVITDELRQMSAAEKRQVIESSGGIPRPDQRIANYLWLMIPTVLSLAFVATLGFVGYLIASDKEISAFVAGFLSALLGYLIGLITPNPAVLQNQGGEG